MNQTKPKITNEQLISFLLGIAPSEIIERIQTEIEQDQELSCQLGFLSLMMPNAGAAKDWVDRRARTDAETRIEGHLEEDTEVADANAQQPHDVPRKEYDERIRQLDLQGHSAEEIGERLGLTNTLVRLKLQQMQRAEGKRDR